MTQGPLAAPLARPHLRFLATTALAPFFAFAPAVPAAAQDDDAFFLGDIVITGTKRDEKLKDIPGSVSVVTSEQMEDRGITDGASAAAGIPGASLYSYGDRTNSFITMRGVGPILMPLSPDDSSVLTFVDGAPLMLEQSASSYLDLEQIEVLKGPQSTLFGRNTSGGAINLVPALPSDTYGGSLTAEMGPDGLYRTEAVANVPIVPGILSSRLALRFSGIDGYVANTAGPELGGEDVVTGRASLLYTPSDETSVLFTYSAENADVTPAYYVPQFGNDDPLDATQSFSTDDSRSRQAMLKITHDFERLSFTSQTSYNSYKTSNSYQGDHRLFSAITGLAESAFEDRDDNFMDWDKDQTRLTQELRFSSLPGDRIGWVAGAVFYRDDYEMANDTHIAAYGATQAGYSTYRQVTTGAALFGDVSVPLSDRLTASGGLRLTREEKDFDGTFDARGYDSVYSGMLSSFSESDESTYEFWTGKAALNYEWSPDFSTYASVSRGYKSGGYGFYNTYMAYGIPRSSYKPTETLSYEIGTRASLLGGRLDLSGAAFFIDMNDEQVMLYNYDLTTSNANLDAESRGVELNAGWRLSDQWRLDTGAAYTRTKITEVPADAATNNPGLAAGNRLPNTPEWSMTFNLGYDAPASALGWTGPRAPDRIHAQIGYSYLGTRYFDAANAGKLDPVNLVSARVGFDWGNTQVYIFGRNLLDEKYLTVRQPYGTAAGTSTPAYGVTQDRGRVLGVGMTVTF
nr:TonB-dependent receptor [Rhodovulum visakhapatnamense]